MGYGTSGRRRLYDALEQGDTEVEHPLGAPPEALRTIGLQEASKAEEFWVLKHSRQQLSLPIVDQGALLPSERLEVRATAKRAFDREAELAAGFFGALIGNQDRHAGQFRFDEVNRALGLLDHG